MWPLTRQEKNLLLILAIVLALGMGLLILKRSFALQFFGSQQMKPWVPLEESPRDLLVFVKGSVEEPGIYRFPLGSRIIQAVQKAKPTLEADMMNMPLADFIMDGQTILVPKTTGGLQDIKDDKSLISSKELPLVVNINRADAVQLDGLPGIGPELAVRIISYRDQHPFVTKEDLLKVAGIGRKKYEQIKDKIEVE